MKKAIFYKEWIKTHRYFWLALIVSSVFVIYALLQLQRVIGFKGVEHLWEILLSRETVFIDTPAASATSSIRTRVLFIPAILVSVAILPETRWRPACGVDDAVQQASDADRRYANASV